MVLFGRILVFCFLDTEKMNIIFHIIKIEKKDE